MKHAILWALFTLALGPTAHAQDASFCQVVGSTHRPACLAVVRAIRRDDPRLLGSLVRANDELSVLGESVRGPARTYAVISRAGGLISALGSTIVRVTYGAPRRTASRGSLPGQILIVLERGAVSLTIERGRARLVSIASGPPSEASDELAHPLQ